jgi:hypothetical protein
MPDGVVVAVRDFLLRQVRNHGDKPYDVASMLTARVFAATPMPGIRSASRRPERLVTGALLAHYKRHYVPGASCWR